MEVDKGGGMGIFRVGFYYSCTFRFESKHSKGNFNTSGS